MSSNCWRSPWVRSAKSMNICWRNGPSGIRASIGRDGAIVYITGIVGLSGDTNDDGVVDAADFITVKQNFGQSTTLDISAGDFDGDGKVEWDDLQAMMSNFSPSQLVGASATNPEPATLGLLALGALALLKRKRKSCLRP
jgi:hypothetical protein